MSLNASANRGLPGSNAGEGFLICCILSLDFIPQDGLSCSRPAWFLEGHAMFVFWGGCSDIPSRVDNFSGTVVIFFFSFVSVHCFWFFYFSFFSSSLILFSVFFIKCFDRYNLKICVCICLVIFQGYSYYLLNLYPIFPLAFYNLGKGGFL